MKNVAWCLGALVTLITLSTACKKDCKPSDPVVIHDTVTVTVPPPPGCIPNLTKGLLAYYPFNGNYNDESGNGNNATGKNGAFLTTDFLGRPNKCAGFDGVDDYLIVTGSGKLNSDTVTVSVQVMVNNANRSNTIINRVGFETGASLVWGLGESLPSDNKYSFAVAPGTDDCSKQSSYDASIATAANGPIVAGRWYNIVASFANGVMKIYVDGVLQSTKTMSFTTMKKCNIADLVIGGWWKGGVLSLDGKIDEVRIYSRLLTECELTKLNETFTQ